MKTKLFDTKLILATIWDININENYFSETYEMFWSLNSLLLRRMYRHHEFFIYFNNLLESLIIISFVFNIKYLIKTQSKSTC